MLKYNKNILLNTDLNVNKTALFVELYVNEAK